MPDKGSFVVLKIALTFTGYYQNIEVSKTVQILIKLYCLAIAILYFSLILTDLPIISIYGAIGGRSLMFCFCILSEDSFLCKYYFQAISYDYKTVATKTIFSKYCIFVFTLFTVVFIIDVNNWYFRYVRGLGMKENSNYGFKAFVPFNAIGLDWAQRMVIATLALLYCQITIFMSSLKTLGFLNAPNYIEMYEFMSVSMV